MDAVNHHAASRTVAQTTLPPGPFAPVVILGVFFIAHGLVTAVIWAAPGGKDAPFDPAHSWLIGDTRTLALLIGAVVGLALVATGAGMIADAAWWPALAVVAGFAGIVLM